MNYHPSSSSSSASRGNGHFDTAPRHYRCDAYHPGDRQPLSFPKEVLESEVHRVREFWDQKQLYYFLTWSVCQSLSAVSHVCETIVFPTQSKMQLIDDEFKHYRLFASCASEVIIFNAELHDIASNAELFVVALPVGSR